MKKNKCILLLLLAAVLVVSVVPAAVFAKDSVSGIEKIQITDDMVSLSAYSAVYNGQDQTPTVTVVYNNETLEQEEFYIVQVSGSGECVEVGTYTITVTGAGDFYGTVTKEFVIKEEQQSEPVPQPQPEPEPEPDEGDVDGIQITDDMVILKPESAVYDGKSHLPAVIVEYMGDRLEEGDDYTYSFNGNFRDIGTSYVKVTGTGSFWGTVTKEFVIKEGTQPHIEPVQDPQPEIEPGSDLDIISEFDPNQIDLDENEVTSYKYDGTDKTIPASELGIPDQLTESKDYRYVYWQKNEVDKWVKVDKCVDIGIYCVVVEFIGDYTGTIYKRMDINETGNSRWGKEVNAGRADSPIINYVSQDGTTSAEVKSGETSWLKEESDGSSAWYGLDNSKGSFEKGSQFWVRWLSDNRDPEEFKQFYDLLDDEHKKSIEDGKLWIFDVGVTNPDGTITTSLKSPSELYIQLGDDWDADSIQACFISNEKDESINVDAIKNCSLPDGSKGKLAELTLEHFSPYVIYVKADEPVTVTAPAEPEPGVTAPQTG